ncbi:MAG TPA: MGMT family protein [Bryobacteraceae bacterium]|jgi:O-6-methylguanine DNA methyltransferase|nr:MGMT family protein [Bryobacteraceae bacterium]
MTGNPRAQRAVGTALAHNRIALLIPCHRVIRESGDVGQYRGVASGSRRCSLTSQPSPSVADGQNSITDSIIE